MLPLRHLARVCLLLAFASAAAASDRSPGREPLFTASSAETDLVVFEWDPSRLRTAVTDGRLVAERFPLPGQRVDLELEPFAVTSPRTRFVIGRKGAADRPVDFDAGRLSLYRGRVRGRAGSSVFIALAGRHTTGYIDLGPGTTRYRISSRDRRGRELGPGRASVYRAQVAMSMPPDVPLCGAEQLPRQTEARPAASAAPQPTGVGSPGLKHLELAVETDYEFFELFGDVDETMTYLVALYAEISDIFIRDTNTWVELVFARVWDDPDDLFNDVDPSPIQDFRNHWNTYMSSVSRDAAQLLSGRRDYPFGGQAYLSVLCGSSAYSVNGYLSGFFPDPSRPSPLHYDIHVPAHELGHNAGTGHTQSNGVDTCDNLASQPQRGTIMAYCSQTWSGGKANQDLYFHSVIQQNIESHVGSASCIIDDCNMNGVADATDAGGTSPDANSNGVPDECEDCNGNSVLDPADIAAETSTDLNLNGIPDECEPDCDGNGIPDDKQIADGASTDAYGNDIPDECETDCNDNDVSDFTEIQLDMTLDVDRDTALDSCQNCDGDFLADHQELGGAHNLWVASGLDNSPIREFYASTGVLTAVSGVTVREGQDVIVAPGGRVLVSSALDDRVVEFGLDGGVVGSLVSGGVGGLDYPTGLLMTPDGTLLVSSRLTDNVLAFNGATGVFIGEFVAAGSGGLFRPFGLTFGLNGNLFVTSNTGEVLEYDGQDGSFVGVFVAAAANGGLTKPRGLVFKPDGNLLVASYGTDEVLEYDGATGAALGKWAQVGTATRLTQVSPWGIRIGPNGNVFVIRTGEDYGGSLSLLLNAEDHDEGHTAQLHLTNAQIYEFDVRSGNFLRSHIGGNDHGMLFPSGFDFVPGWQIDCNNNLLQDDCDIESGHSEDVNDTDVPDECEIDCNANGTLDRLDIVPFGSSLDCNANLVPDTCDLAGGGSADCTFNGIPDECEADCNGNGSADSCDIDAGTSTDCNANGVPDACDQTFDFESAQGWSASDPGDTATDGGWTRVNPNATAAQTEFDHTPGAGRDCYVTGDGPVGGSASADDVDGGTTTLTSPAMDLSGDADPEIGYWRWFSNDTGGNPGEDVLLVEVSNDGGSGWTPVETVGPAGSESSGGWFFHQFRVADFVTPTSDVRIRFVAADLGGDSTVEAAVDDVVRLAGCCQTAAACDDGLTCTIDSCNVPAGQCGSAIDASSCLIGRSCYAADDLNPADDCEACDPASPTTWSDDSPTEITGVTLEKAGMARLTWDMPGNGFVYDIAGDLLSVLQAQGGVAGAGCVEDDVGVESWDDPRPDPPAGDGYYYLIRSQKTCGDGGYGADSVGLPRLPLAACP